MHTEIKKFVRRVKRNHLRYFWRKKVLEVGSLNINGSVRKFFRWCDYTGLDLIEGKGVDVVAPIKTWKEPNMYDVIISTEMLEHDCDWKESLQQMYDNLKPGGLLILTCACTNRAEHGTKRTSPQDSPATTEYYRNITIGDFVSILHPALFKRSFIEEARGRKDLLFYGIKN